MVTCYLFEVFFFFKSYILDVMVLTWLKQIDSCFQGFLFYQLEAILGILIKLKTKQKQAFPFIALKT